MPPADRDFSRALLNWFEVAGRSALPWRAQPTPYRVLVSEFMLQQTQVDRVVPIFERFVAAWPTFEALASAARADVVRAWKGLGYNARAVRLHCVAGAVVAQYGGTLPQSEAALRALPGIGAYTARAVAAFAFSLDVAAVDTNVRRIVHRTQFGLEWPPLAGERELDVLATALVPAGHGFAFNSALMDLGATLCTARAPKCLLCPLARLCAAAPVDPARLAEAAARHARPRGGQQCLPFAATSRYVRGRVVDRLRTLQAGEKISLLALFEELQPALEHHDFAALRTSVAALSREGIVRFEDEQVRLA